MTPDTPLLFFTVVAIWALARVRTDRRWWLLVGVATGCALDSKYTGVLLGLAIPLWLFWARLVAILRTPWPWAGGALAALLFAPVVAWNAGHEWASFVKQGGRVGDWAPWRALQFLGELLGGQIALATPLVFVLFAAGLRRAVAGAARREAAATLLAALTLPGLLLFAQHAFGARVQANWVAVLYPPLAIAAALASTSLGARWWRAACAVGLALTAAVYGQAAAHPLALPRRLDPTLMRLAGWDRLATAADAMRRAQGLAFVASEDYSEAAALAWEAPPGVEVVGAEPRWRLFRLPAPKAGAGLLLISERRREGPNPALWSEARQIGEVARSRGGVEAERYRVYRATLKAGASAAALPRPGGE